MPYIKTRNENLAEAALGKAGAALGHPPFGIWSSYPGFLVKRFFFPYQRPTIFQFSEAVCRRVVPCTSWTAWRWGWVHSGQKLPTFADGFLMLSGLRSVPD